MVALLLSSAALLWLPSTVPAARPANPTNITAYHVNPRKYGAIPFNMDAGDSQGDLYFVMRSVVGPIECAAQPGAEDCTDVEVVSSTLVASRLHLEISNATGRYGHCNICTNVTSAKRLCETCCSEASQLGQYRCSGWLLDQQKVGEEAPAKTHSTECKAGMPPWECWRNRVALKFGGTWWSFFNESYCGSDGDAQAGGAEGGVGVGGACAWRVVAPPRSIWNHCLMDRVYSAIEAFAPSCFGKCPPSHNATPKRNVSDPCWIGCVYGTVLGAGAGDPNATIGPQIGMPLEKVVAAWEGAFDDSGGCQPVVTA
jgi:hypothetical protein